ncbi:hypothetical protein A0O36_01658 [Piscirickettsiaceae bacterium NZ-RLO1]|nr:hypothetical protein A0O36_01658 [Piscirickettsiaceae bacterium NZ-RLO1]
MPIIYPGIQVSLDPRQSDRCKGRSLCSFSGQSYFSSHPTNKGQQNTEINKVFIQEQDAHLEKKAKIVKTQAGIAETHFPFKSI